MCRLVPYEIEDTLKEIVTVLVKGFGWHCSLLRADKSIIVKLPHEQSEGISVEDILANVVDLFLCSTGSRSEVIKSPRQLHCSSRKANKRCNESYFCRGIATTSLRGHWVGTWACTQCPWVTDIGAASVQNTVWEDIAAVSAKVIAEK
jgi:hypothetical protein